MTMSGNDEQTWRATPNPQGGWWVTCLEHPAQYVSVAGEHLVKRFQLQYHYEADALVERLNDARRVAELEAALSEARAALEQYGDHSVICYDANQQTDMNGEWRGCVCGYLAALTRPSTEKEQA